MLAQNFMSQETLGITQDEWAALIRVLGMLEREEIPFGHWIKSSYNRADLNMTHFNMATVVSNTDCGTAGCICGWARFLTGDWNLFNDALKRQEGGALNDLFLMGGVSIETEMLFVTNFGQTVRPGQAAIALRNYLTTGKSRWKEALDA